MIPLEDMYFEWLLHCIDQDGVTEGLEHLCGLLHNCEFHRRVGNDINRAIDGANLRKEFLAHYEEVHFDPNSLEELLQRECTWLEMLIALARHLDYLYEGGVDGRLVELVNNMRLGQLAGYYPNRTRSTLEFDQHLVNRVTSAINNNRITVNGHGGLFPLSNRHHHDQREVEIWEQHSAYFNEKLGGGGRWTSIR